MFTPLRPQKKDPYAQPRSFRRPPERDFRPRILALNVGLGVVSNQHYLVNDLLLRPNLRLRWLAAENYVFAQLRGGILPLTIVSRVSLIDHDLLCSESIRE